MSNLGARPAQPVFSGRARKHWTPPTLVPHLSPTNWNGQRPWPSLRMSPQLRPWPFCPCFLLRDGTIYFTSALVNILRSVKNSSELIPGIPLQVCYDGFRLHRPFLLFRDFGIGGSAFLSLLDSSCRQPHVMEWSSSFHVDSDRVLCNAVSHSRDSGMTWSMKRSKCLIAAISLDSNYASNTCFLYYRWRMVSRRTFLVRCCNDILLSWKTRVIQRHMVLV